MYRYTYTYMYIYIHGEREEQRESGGRPARVRGGGAPPRAERSHPPDRKQIFQRREAIRRVVFPRAGESEVHPRTRGKDAHLDRRARGIPEVGPPTGKLTEKRRAVFFPGGDPTGRDARTKEQKDVAAFSLLAAVGEGCLPTRTTDPITTE